MASAEMTTASPSRPRPGPPRCPDLTLDQRQLILTAAGEIIRASILEAEAVFADPTLAGAADQDVSGAFVSLKRGGHLRSCCGGLVDQAVPLMKVLRDAAVRTALEDVRFPPVSAIELDHLEMEVWILYNPLPVRAHGEERAAAVVTGGKHGVVVSRGEARGLLLPGVAQAHRHAQWRTLPYRSRHCLDLHRHPANLPKPVAKGNGLG